MARADQEAWSTSFQLVAQRIGSAIADVIGPPRVLFENHRIGRDHTISGAFVEISLDACPVR